MKAKIVAILEAEACAVRSVPLDNPYEKVLKVIHTAEKKKGRLIVTGVGKAGDVGRKIVSTFNSVGIPSLFLSPLDARHGDLGIVGPNDALFLISNSGKTNEIVELVHLARELHAHIPTICLTAHADSPLGKSVDYVLRTGNPKEVCPLGLTPTSSVLAMLAVADVLTVLSMEQRKYSADQYRKRHHSGYLGKKAVRMAKSKR